MKNMKYRLGTLLLLLSLCSCSNILSKNVKAESNTYVTIVPGDVSVRSVNPTEEYALEHLSSIYFDAKKAGVSKRNLANGLSKLSNLYDRQFILEDGAGEYTFELQGVIDNITFYDKLENVQIAESATNAITFELEPVSGSSNPNVPFEDFGGISITLNFNKTNVKKIHYTLQDFATWDDELLDGYGDWAIVEQGDITSLSSGTVKYEHLVKNTTGNTARLPVGTYRLTFDFMAEDGTDFVLINSFPYVVNVAKGRNSYLVETFDLNPVYTITYTDNGGSLAPGEKRPTKFTNVDRPVLPKMEKAGFTFKGWYSSSSFTSETGPLATVPENWVENLPLYARFESSALYVDYGETDDSNTGLDSEHKLKTLDAAIDIINNSTDKNLDWQIFIYGTYPVACEIPNTVYGNAKSITLTGAAGTDSITVSTGSVPALTINAATSSGNRVDVKIKNLSITGGVYVNTDSKLYVSGKTVIDNLVVEDSFTDELEDAPIYLADNLTSGSSITFTPDNYEDDAPYLYYSSVYKTRYVYTISEQNIKISDNRTYFHITPQDGSTKNWYIDDDGCLTFDCTVSFKGPGTSPESYPPVSVPCCSTILPGNAYFQAPSNPGYVFVGWTYKKLISNSPETYDARIFVFEGEFNYDATFIEEDMELISTWVCDTATLYVDAEDGINLIEYDDTEHEIVFADGSQTAQFDSIDCALEAIRIINNPARDYTIIVSGLTDEYNIQIDDTTPANSITLQGATTPASGELPADGIECTSSSSNDFESILLVEENAPDVTIKNMRIQLHHGSLVKDGIAIKIEKDSNVTLDQGAAILGSTNSTSFESNGAIAVENGASLLMKTGAVIKNFDMQISGVYVKQGGTFEMQGGTISNNEAEGSTILVEGSFTMSGGEISGNKQSGRTNGLNGKHYNGAGVCVYNGSFTMSGGNIINNTSHVLNYDCNMPTFGGGVYVNAGGSFIMENGEISGNRAAEEDGNGNANTNASSYANGGGICIEATETTVGSFTMTGGTISGNTAVTSGNAIGFYEHDASEGISGKITLGGTAVIAADNDIYLPDYVKIEVASELTNAVDDATKPVITPASYTRTTALVTLAQGVDEGLAATEFVKFGVTKQNPGETDEREWSIGTDGKLLTRGLIAKTKANAVGDIVLKDGTVYGNALNTDASDIPNEIKNNAVAVIFYAGTASDTLGARVIGLGLYNSDETNPDGFVWADSSAYGYDNKLTDLLHDPSNNIYDNDGRDNWTKLCTADSTGTSPANAATKYPAFNWVNNYATNFSVGDKYTDNWFMPSAGEMSILWGSSQETMDQVLQKLGSTIMDWDSYKWYWTSSQSSYASQAYSRQGNNSTAKAKYYPYAVLACYDFTDFGL